LRWKHNIADGLAGGGKLRTYITGFASSPELERRVTRFLPSQGKRVATKYLSLRRLPAGIPPDRVERVAQSSGLLTAAAFRASSNPRVHMAMFAFVGHRFDAAAAECLHPQDRVAIVAADSSLRTIEAAQRLGITTVLDHPVGHCDFELAISREERRLRPDFAGTLPIVHANAKRRARLKAEIAAADRILVNSNFARETFLEQGVAEERVLVIHHAVDLEMFRPRDQERVDDGRFRVLFAGRITQLKGIAYVIDAFDRAAIPGSELRFVGKPFGATEAWRNHPRLQHKAAVPIHELREEYVASDVYVLPSLCEGFPHTAIMAMACGLPCIVSENTFGRDVITDGVDGFVVPIRDTDAIAERLLMLSRNPDLRRGMGEAARQRAQEFTWERFGHRISNLVADLGA
jgi:glycosyltransferase involved in cell wall biosynthesis